MMRVKVVVSIGVVVESIATRCLVQLVAGSLV